ncbi:hypothetical protein FHL15_001912 [Xylaria flabelliformis]|uniref:Uncharacterized protein n=1 Tax=Xylaria flabelliformis TaxID=2512241 RepID=A0A553IA93_9PEZI|nr:hypothetical protein FHL15_001912 [Xylaria flabelliformis]
MIQFSSNGGVHEAGASASIGPNDENAIRFPTNQKGVSDLRSHNSRRVVQGVYYLSTYLSADQIDGVT